MMTRGVILSIFLHVTIVVIAILGLPVLFSDPIKEEPVITVEILPITSITNVKPQKPAPTPKVKPAPKKPTPPPRPEPETPKPTPQEDVVQETKPAPKPIAEEPKDVVSLDKTPKPKPNKKPKPPKRPKVVKKTPPKKPKTETKEEVDPFDALEKNLDKLAKAQPKQKEETLDDIEKSLSETSKPYDDSIPLSLSEEDAMQQQLRECWSRPIGIPGIEDMRAKVHFTLQRDGTITSAKLIKTTLYYSDPYYRVFADSALDAVHRCNPLKYLPPQEKYDTWKESKFTFNPNDM